MEQPKNVAEMSIRQINAYFRKHDDRHLWPICWKFSPVERAIRRIRRMRRKGLEIHAGLEYYLAMEQEMRNIVNEEI